jgi:hypothetical protein
LQIEFTEEALNYLKKTNINSIKIDLIPRETSTCCGGASSTRRYFTPSINTVLSNENVSNIYTKIENKYNIKIFVPLHKLYVLNNRDIIIDLDSFLFVKKLVLKNMEIILI